MTTPQPGDFGLTRIPGAAGLAIRLGQYLAGAGFEDYEHAFIVIDNDQIVEAEPGGARVSPLSEYPADTIEFSHWTLTDQQRSDIVTHARSMVGTPYSAFDYFAIAAHRLHLPMPGLKRYIGTSTHAICSQLVDLCYQAAGLQMFADGRWPGYVMPASLEKVLAGPLGG
jgi:uncharacterized protein YycO